MPALNRVPGDRAVVWYASSRYEVALDALPQASDAIRIEGSVRAHNRDFFDQGLRNQEAVKRVAVVMRQ